MTFYILLFLVLVPENNEIGVIQVTKQGSEWPMRMTEQECKKKLEEGTKTLEKQFPWVKGGCVSVVSDPV